MKKRTNTLQCSERCRAVLIDVCTELLDFVRFSFHFTTLSSQNIQLVSAYYIYCLCHHTVHITLNLPTHSVTANDLRFVHVSTLYSVRARSEYSWVLRRDQMDCRSFMIVIFCNIVLCLLVGTVSLSSNFVRVFGNL